MKKGKLEQKLEIAKQHAKNKGGECLSSIYENNSTHMTWTCGNQTHKEWNATYKKVVCCGTWCPQCSSEIAQEKRNQSPKLSAQERLTVAHAHAKAKGGVCLTERPASPKQPLTWKCSQEQHPTWTALHDSVVKLGSWCPECGKEQRAESRTNKEALEIAKEHAIKFGGQCLSTEYVKARDYLTWKCRNEKHQPWTAWYDTVVRRGVWCKQCAFEKNISENRVRAFFEEFFGQPFPSQRPVWNKNPWTGNLLELDGYCSTFNIAFEHDGEHHFAINKFSDKYKKKDFVYQQFKDEQKRKNCQEHGVLLISIPIVDSADRNDFEKVLSNVIEYSRQSGLKMDFSEQQIEKLKDRFYKGE